MNYNIENLSGPHTDNTGKTDSGGSYHSGQKQKYRDTVALDDMEEEEEKFQEYKVPESKDDLTQDLANAAQMNIGYRDRLFSSSGVIIEGTTLHKKKKSSDQKPNIL